MIGCDKQESSKPSPVVAPPPQAKPAESPASGTSEAATPPSAQPPPPANATEMAASNLLTVNVIFKEWVERNKRVPKDFEELLAAKAFRVPPKPPAGKRFAIDPQKVEVILADR